MSVNAPEKIKTKMHVQSTVPGTPGSDAILYAKSVMAWPVRQGQSVKVSARIDNVAPYKSSFHDGWTWGGPDHLSGPDGKVRNKQFTYNPLSVCKSAPYGMLVGAFVPVALKESLDMIDLATDANALILETVMANSVPVGPNWQGVAPFEGFLVLLMNDAIRWTANPGHSGYSDNDGAMIVNVSA